MENKRPQRFDVALIHDAVSKSDVQQEGFFFNNEFAVLHGPGTHLFHFFLGRHTPLLVNDYRMGVVLQGELHVRMNLIEHRIKAGTMVFIGPGTIVEPISITPDVHVIGLALFRDLPFSVGRVPTLFNGSVRDCRIVPGEQQLSLVRQLIECLWLTVHTQPFCRPAFDALAAALMQLYNDFHSQDMEQQEGTTHGTDIFNRFIQLVNGHARQEHKLAYYADRMCLTQRYLGSVVREVSGATAKEWIDRAIVTEAKVMLRHSDKPMSVMADELHFPSPSFFAKFFRRITGLTPAEYRAGN